MLMNACHETSDGVITASPPSDVVVFFHTLVQDGALPSGYESDFAALGPYIFLKQIGNSGSWPGLTMTMFQHPLPCIILRKNVHRWNKLRRRQLNSFLRQLSNKPKVYKTRLQRSFYQTSTARRDTEEAERVR